MSLQARWSLDNRAGYKPSLIDYSTWELGKSGSQHGFGQNGATSESEIILKENPLGVSDITWATEQNDTDSNSDGGFNTTTHAIDRTKPYRISCWLRRENAVEALGGGSTYFGVRGYTGGSHTGLIDSNGTVNKNPYFNSHSIGTYGVTNDSWFLYIGYVYPSTHNYTTDTSYSDGGIWTTGGTKIANNSSFKFSDTNDRLMMRSYLYYSTKTDERMYWYRPRIDVMDGTEPSFNNLLSLVENPNVLTYIPDLSINKYNLLHGSSHMTIEDGKIGQCHRFHSSSISRLFVKDFMVGKKIRDFTMTTFVKFISGGNTSLNSMISVATNEKDNALGIFYWTASRRIELQINGTGNIYIPLDLSAYSDKWVHLSVRRTNGFIEVFANGDVSSNTVTNNGVISFGTSNQLAIGSEQDGINAGFNVGQSLNGCLNDLRFYDHSLSKKEIKEISRGKILHYTFNDFQEPTTNMWAGDKYTWSQGSGTTTRDSTDQVLDSDFEVVKIETSTEGSVYSSIPWTVSGVEGPDIKYTMSAYIYLESGTYVYFYHHWNPWAQGEKHYIPKNKWMRLSFTITTNAEVDSGRVALQFSTDGAIYVTKPQYEKKEYMTEFTLGSRGGNIVDSSGMSNHSTLSEDTTPRWTRESALGTGSYKFPSVGNKIININNYIQKVVYEEVTVSARFRVPDGEIQSQSWGGYIVSNSPDGSIGNSVYTIAVRSDGQVAWGWSGTHSHGTSTTIYNNGEWHTVTGVWNGTHTIMYIDGEQITSYPTTLNRSGLDGRMGLGSSPNDSGFRQFNGDIDDVRVYATAMSSSDVLKLHKSRANLDSNGNLSVNEIKPNEAYELGNLVYNGNGQLESNSNFYTLDWSESDNAFVESDESVSVVSHKQAIQFEYTDSDKSIDYSVLIKGDLAGTHDTNVGIQCLDKDFNHISFNRVNNLTNTRTTLAQPVNNGDTTITITDGSNWRDGDISPFGYIGIFENNFTYRSSDIQPVRYTGLPSSNVITLQNPWDKGSYPTGTKVAQCYAGGTYQYLMNGVLTNEYVKRQYTITSSDLRYGTKYITPLFLTNRDSLVDETTYVKNISMKPISGVFRTVNLPPAYSGVENDAGRQKSLGVNKKGQIKINNISEVGITDGMKYYYDWSIGSESLEGGKLPTNIVGGGSLVADAVASTGTDGEYIRLDATYTASITNEETIIMVAKKATDGNAIFHVSRAWSRRLYVNSNRISYSLYLKDSAGGNNTIHAVESPYNYSDKNFFAVSYGSGIMKIYDENGKNPVSNDISSGTSVYLYDIDEILLGRYSSGSSANYYENEWYKLKIFNRQLTDQEVAVERKALMGDEKMFITRSGTAYANNFKEVN